MIIVMLGKPGGGKGTASQMLSKETGLTHISSGDLFKAYAPKAGEVGEKIMSYITSGQLVPDELVFDLIGKRLEEDDVKEGVILDGFPRTIAQAEKLDEWMKEQGKEIDTAVNIEVDDETIIKRLSERFVCSNEACGEIYNLSSKPTKVEGICDLCGSPLKRRPDDEPEVIQKRLDGYAETTGKLVDYYNAQGKLFNFISTDSPREFVDAIEKHLETLK